MQDIIESLLADIQQTITKGLPEAIMIGQHKEYKLVLNHPELMNFGFNEKNNMLSICYKNKLDRLMFSDSQEGILQDQLMKLIVSIKLLPLALHAAYMQVKPQSKPQESDIGANYATVEVTIPTTKTKANHKSVKLASEVNNKESMEKLVEQIEEFTKDIDITPAIDEDLDKAIKELKK